MTILNRVSVKRTVLAGLLLAATVLAQHGPKDSINYPRLNAIKMPKVHETVLANGMKLYLVEDADYPTIDLRAMIRTGSVYESADKVGLAGITGEVMRSGGSEKYPGDALDKLLETLAAAVETSIGSSSGSAAISVLKEDIDKGLDVLADLLMHPRFPEDKLDLAKVQLKSAISRRNDDVGGITNREFDKLIYGAQSPYARHEEYATIDAIGRDDMVAFHKQYFHPNNIALAVWGDFKWKTMKQQIESAFGGWSKGPAAPVQPPLVRYNFDSSVSYIEKTDVNQSNIMLGHIGGLRKNADYPALIIMNQILSFDRLFKRVRTDEGLAYSVYGAYGAGYQVPGTFNCGCQTKSETTVKAINIITEEIKRMQDEAVTAAELEKAKSAYLNSYVFNFQSKGQIINRLLRNAYFGYPADFSDQVKAGVERVSMDDVQRVAQNYLKPDQMRILVVGNDADFDQPLSVLGEVKTIDITIPEPKIEAVPAGDAAAMAEGMALLQKTREALGGDKLATVRNAKIKGSASQAGMTMETELLIQYPGSMRMTLTTPMGDVAIVVTPEAGWQNVPGRGVMDMPPSQLEAQKQTLLRDLICLLGTLEGRTAQLLEPEERDGKEVAALQISLEGYSFKMLVDTETNLPMAMIYQAATQQGPAEVTSLMLKYQSFEGIQLPTAMKSMVSGQVMAEEAITEVTFNVTVPEGAFTK